MPAVESMRPVITIPLTRKMHAILYDQIVSEGMTDFAFLFGVYKKGEKVPSFCVASEVNSMAEEFGGGSHFFTTWASDGTHSNYNDSNDWADPEKFLAKALRTVEEVFHAVPLEQVKP